MEKAPQEGHLLAKERDYFRTERYSARTSSIQQAMVMLGHSPQKSWLRFNVSSNNKTSSTPSVTNTTTPSPKKRN